MSDVFSMSQVICRMYRWMAVGLSQTMLPSKSKWTVWRLGEWGEMSGEAGAEDKKMQVAGMSATIPTHFFFNARTWRGGVLTSLCFDTGRLDAKAGV